MELALKDRHTKFPHGHDLSVLTQSTVTVASGLQAQLTTLERLLKALYCTHRGARTPLDPAQYPSLRYLRHEKDGFLGDSSDADIRAALVAAEQLVKELANAGVSV